MKPIARHTKIAISVQLRSSESEPLVSCALDTRRRRALTWSMKTSVSSRSNLALLRTKTSTTIVSLRQHTYRHNKHKIKARWTMSKSNWIELTEWAKVESQQAWRPWASRQRRPHRPRQRLLRSPRRPRRVPTGRWCFWSTPRRIPSQGGGAKELRLDLQV